jgi:hypothetical protein
MIDRPKYDPPERLFKEFFGLVSTLNARKNVDKKKKSIKRQPKERIGRVNRRPSRLANIGKRNFI